MSIRTTCAWVSSTLLFCLTLASPTRASIAPCIGDCDGDGAVTVDEILIGINIALNLTSAESCGSIDVDLNSVVTVDELVLAVQAALQGCATPPVNRIEIISPANGTFTAQESVEIHGVVVDPTMQTFVTINGVDTELGSDGTFAAEVALEAALILNPILAAAGDPNGPIGRDRIVVGFGDSIAAGDPVENGVALRLTESGLAKLGEALPSILDLDADSLIPPGTRVVNNYCVIDSPFGCIERVDVVAESARFDALAIDLESVDGFLVADVTVSGLVVPLEIRGSIFDCDGRATVERVRIAGNYQLGVVPDDGSIDVNVDGAPLIEIAGDTFEFTGGACDDDPIDDLIDAVVGDFRPRLRAALEEYLEDPDGTGPQDAPVAAAMQNGFTEADFTAPLGEAFGVMFETVTADIETVAGGVTFAADALATAPPPAMSSFPASYRVEETFPNLSSTTPLAGTAFDIGLCLSTSTVNQMIKALTEAGELGLDLTEVDFGSGPVPLTAGALSLIIPEARALASDLPIVLRFRTTVPPLLTGAPGPAGELADLRVANLLFEVISNADTIEVVHLRAALDARAAFDLIFTEDGRRLRVALTPPRPEDIAVTVLNDRLDVDEARLQSNLPRVVAQFVNRLSPDLGAFELPELFGLRASGVELSRAGGYPCMFLALEAPGPGTGGKAAPGVSIH